MRVWDRARPLPGKRTAATGRNQTRWMVSLCMRNSCASCAFLQTAVLLLLLEQQRKANEDEVKQAKTIADRARVDALHEWHLGAEKVWSAG